MSAKSILIVEDDPTLLRGLKDNFRAQGYQVRAAALLRNSANRRNSPATSPA